MGVDVKPIPLPLDTDFLEPERVLDELNKLHTRIRNQVVLNKSWTGSRVPLLDLIGDGSSRPDQAYFETWVSLKHWAGVYCAKPINIDAPPGLVGALEIREIIEWVEESINSLEWYIENWAGRKVRKIPYQEKLANGGIVTMAMMLEYRK